MPVALVTGIAGQDGSYLAEFLLGQGYEVHGVMRRTSTINTWRLDDMETEVRQAMSAGIDGFAVDILSTSSTAQTYDNIELLLQAAKNVSSTFKIMLQPDMSALASKDLASIAAATAALGKYPAALNNSNRHHIVSPLHAAPRSV